MRFNVNEREAQSASRNVGGEMDQIKRKAEEAQREAEKARRSGQSLDGRVQSLRDRARKRGVYFRDNDLAVGAMKIGATGIGLRQSFMKGRMGSAAGPLAAVYAVRMGAAGASNAGHALADFIQDGESLASVLKNAPGRLADKIGNWTTSPSANLAGMIMRFSHGLTRADSEMLVQHRMAEVWGGESDLDATLAAQRERTKQWQERFWAQQDAAERAREEAARKREQQLNDAFEQIDSELARRLDRVRVGTLPARVSNDMFERLKSEHRAREKAGAHAAREEAKRRIGENEGS